MAGMLRTICQAAKTSECTLQGSGGVSYVQVSDGKGARFCVRLTTAPVICSKVLADCWTVSPAVATLPSHPYLAVSENTSVPIEIIVAVITTSVARSPETRSQFGTFTLNMELKTALNFLLASV